jgi:tRNA modification GTPase
VLWLVDATAPTWHLPPTAIAEIPPQKNAIQPHSFASLFVLNKIDLARVAAGPERVEISATTGQGLDRLIAVLQARAAELAEASAVSPLMTRARHRTELEAAQAALLRFADPELSPELKAEELRIAARPLGRLTGRIDVEEMLGAIFAEFCIGK